MSHSLAQKSILIVEPNLSLKKPYSFLDSNLFRIVRENNSLTAATSLQEQRFDLVFLSCSFSNKKILSFLESLKQASGDAIIPLILVVDFGKPYSIIPGLIWDNKLGLLNSHSGAKELRLHLDKLLH